jgi:hypothetical protein
MRGESKQEQPFDGSIERLVVLAVLGRRRGCPRSRLLAELSDIEPRRIEHAVASLERAGVLDMKRTRLHPTAGVQRLDDLSMICL